MSEALSQELIVAAIAACFNKEFAESTEGAVRARIVVQSNGGDYEWADGEFSLENNRLDLILDDDRITGNKTGSSGRFYINNKEIIELQFSGNQANYWKATSLQINISSSYIRIGDKQYQVNIS
ncbi:MAG: hypothetical protein PVJ09_01675 [Candidatus Woesebacteria bacterium]|jgi:hypothetical protein